MTLISRTRILALAAAVAASLPMAAQAADDSRREPAIVVTGQGQSMLAPDMAIVSVGIVRQAKTAREALSANNEAMRKVLEALKGAGIAERDLQTSGFSINPQYSYPDSNDGTPRAPVLTGYEVANQLTIRVRDIARLGAVLDQTVSLGVNQGGDIRFTNAEPEKAVEEARRNAMKNAIGKARVLAEAAGVKAGRILEISETMDLPEPRPVMRMSMAKEAADAVPVAAGENSYSVTVNVTFAIEQ